MSEKLRNCPFCGENPSIKNVTLPFDVGKGRKITQCKCGAFLYAGRWNTRPIEDALRAELEKRTAELHYANTACMEMKHELARRDEELALTEKKLCNIDRSARAEVARRDEIITRLKEALPTLKISHSYCEDNWYSCPLAEDGCADERRGTECDCGADKHNAVIDALMKELE